jgi:hypothetical protein
MKKHEETTSRKQWRKFLEFEKCKLLLGYTIASVVLGVDRDLRYQFHTSKIGRFKVLDCISENKYYQ